MIKNREKAFNLSAKILINLLVSFTVIFTIGIFAISTNAEAKTAREIKHVKSKDVCPDKGKNNAKCTAKVATDDKGIPLASPAPLSTSYGPAQYHTAYNLPCTPNGPVQSNCETPSSFGPQTIGIVVAYHHPTLENDLNVYSQQFGIPPCTQANGCLTILDQNGGTNFSTGFDALWTLEASLDTQLAHGICQTCKILVIEANSTSASDLATAERTAVSLGATAVSNSWGFPESGFDKSSFIHPGTAIVAGSGDSGYGAFLWPANIPQVVAVGGTTLNINTDNTYRSESVWDGAGSGCVSSELAFSWQTNLPNWSQTGCGITRAVSDVSANADPSTGAAIYDSTPYGGSTGWYQLGGTSASTPVVAAAYALAGGVPANHDAPSVLYANYNTSNFNDVISGTNNYVCNSIMCKGETGYDGPTGLGSLNGLGAFNWTPVPYPTSAPTPTPTPPATAPDAPDLSTFNQTSICDSSTLTSNATFSWGPTANTYYYDINWDGSGITKDTGPAGALGNNSFSLFGLTPGRTFAWWQVRSTNSYGSSSWTTQNIPFTTVLCPDNINPTISITNPTNGSAVTGTINLQVNATDNIGVTKVEYYQDGTLINSSETSPYSISWDTSGLTQGSSHVLTAKAYDAAGNSTTSEAINVTIKDITAPNMTILSPSSGQIWNNPVSIITSASDNIGVTKVELWKDNDTLAFYTCTTLNQGYCSLSTYLFTTGQHTLHAHAYDAAGNIGISSIAFAVDTTAPTVSITNPANGSTVTGTVQIQASASDNIGVTSVEFYQNGNLIGTSNSAPYTFNWNTSSLVQGDTYVLSAKAYDSAGNSTISPNVTATIKDIISPTTSIISPTSGSTVTGTVQISANASDNLGVSKVDFYSNGSLLGSSTFAPYTFSWDTSGLAQGATYALTTKTYDNAGNTGTSSSVNVTIKDITAPTVNITSPANNSKVTRSSRVTISATASDNIGVNKVEFYVNNSLKCTDTTATYTCSWSVPSQKNIKYTLTTKAYDPSGNIGTNTISVTSN